MAVEKRDMVVDVKSADETYSENHKIWILGDSHVRNLHNSLWQTSVTCIGGGRLQHVQMNLRCYRSLRQYEVLCLLIGGNNLSRHKNGYRMYEDVERLVRWIAFRFSNLQIVTGSFIPRGEKGFMGASMFVNRKIEQASSRHHHFYHKMFLRRGSKRSWEIQEDYFCRDRMHLKSESYGKI